MALWWAQQVELLWYEKFDCLISDDLLSIWLGGPVVNPLMPATPWVKMSPVPGQIMQW